MELDSISELTETTNALMLDDVVRWNGRLIQALGNTFSRTNHKDMSILAMSRLPENIGVEFNAGADENRGPYVELKINVNINPSDNDKSDKSSAPDSRDRDHDKDSHYG